MKRDFAVWNKGGRPLIDLTSWIDADPIEWRWPHFSPRELAERSSKWEEGRSPLRIDENFLDHLEALRMAFGRPLIVTSGYRSPEHNKRVSSTGNSGPHTTGRAVDVHIYGSAAFDLLDASLAHGFTGIGLQQKGPVSSRFIHLDDLPGNDTRKRPWIWSY
ncbi:D-Ala-D-Ala carboxypeptidase family metallohydrolase [Limibacillus sp. MBR-115]|jgi:uncharacterized protein YcbK (DUF882 family)|uniref:D-Ala-D-Ala carboxypeptidase family metallohydrolase n=1 Tax=Limibacillus sp. MBR-115 TaxID=3156465 RepID=UPI003393F270